MLIEKETVINFNKSEQLARLYTTQKVIINKLNKFCEIYPEFYKEEINQDIYGKNYLVNKDFIVFKKPRILTKKQKLKLLSNLKK